MLVSSYKNWHWYLSNQDGTVQIYHNNDLCWELDCCNEMSLREINITVKNTILQYQHMLLNE